jgi:hypothetical protein
MIFVSHERYGGCHEGTEGSGSIAPLILNLGIRWGGVVRFTHFHMKGKVDAMREQRGVEV